MSSDSAEWVGKSVAVRFGRTRAADELTREMLSRSYRQLAESEELLKLGVPIVWHPEPPASRPAACSVNPTDGEMPAAAAPSSGVRPAA